MARIEGKNKWGIYNGLEPQRSDLWVLDLSQVLNGIKTANVSSVNGTFDKLKNNIISDAPTAYQFAQRISLPSTRITSTQVVQKSVPESLPGIDEPCGIVRIDFTADVPVTSNPQYSKIIATLQSWRMLVRAGRVSLSESEDYILLPSASSRPPNSRFNVNVFLLCGTGDISTVDNAAAQVYNISSKIQLCNCWITEIQINELSRTSGVLQITAVLQPSAIVPIPNDDLTITTNNYTLTNAVNTTLVAGSSTAIITDPPLSAYANFKGDYSAVTVTG